ncbi:MAG: hypothetical protein HYV02_02640 [Deltaproteobacteria bacterium]|nr:hypothetical protein [Deltaproteobacteria bacterium]
MSGLFKQYGWCFNLSFLLILAFFLAKIANVYLGSLLEVSRSIAVVSGEKAGPLESAIGDYAAYEAIVERNIFDASTVESVRPCQPDDARPECQGQVDTVQAPPTGEAVKTSLNITLLATMVVGEGKDGRSTAAIDTGRGEIDVYAVGDREKPFHPGVVLVQIKPKRIEFLNNQRLEYADLAEESAANIFVPPEQMAENGETTTKAVPPGGIPTGDQVSQVGDNRYVVNQGEIDAALGNLDQLYTQIRAVPNFEGGQVKGMKILSIKPGSLFSKLGLRRGDVLDRINGNDIDIKSGFQLFSQLKEQKQFTLDLKRGGKRETFEYEIR